MGEASETALFNYRRLLFEPVPQFLAGAHGHIEEANPSAALVVLPHEFCGYMNALRIAGNRKVHVHTARRRKVARPTLEGGAGLAQVGDEHLRARRTPIANAHRNHGGHALGSATTVAPHQIAHGTK